MKILSRIPSKKNLELYNKILSKQMGVDYKLNKILNDYFGEDKHLIDNVFAGLTVKHLSVKELNDLDLMIEIGDFMKDPDNQDLLLDIKLDMLSKQFKVGTNKIFQLYERYKYYLKEIEDEKV